MDNNLRLLINQLITRKVALEQEVDELIRSIQFIEKLEPKLKIKEE